MAGLERDVIAKVMGPLWWRQGLRLENTNSKLPLSEDQRDNSHDVEG